MQELIKIDDNLINVIPDKRAALMACVKVSGVPMKSVAADLSIEYTHLSKMLAQTQDPRHFPQEKEDQLMNICRNEIPLIWMLLKRGYPSIRQILDMQIELETLRAENIELRASQKGVINVFKTIGG